MKKLVLAIIVLIIATAGGWYLFGRSSSSQSSNTTPTRDANTSSTSGSQTPVATSSVKISSSAFSPSDITVTKGTTVTWINNDSVSHTVTESDGQDGPASATLNPSQSYSFTYTTVGTYEYHCTFHSSMTGSVTVTE